MPRDFWRGEASRICMRRANGGGRGIRTLETVSRLHTFQACAFDHSATPPCGRWIAKPGGKVKGGDDDFMTSHAMPCRSSAQMTPEPRATSPSDAASGQALPRLRGSWQTANRCGYRHRGNDRRRPPTLLETVALPLLCVACSRSEAAAHRGACVGSQRRMAIATRRSARPVRRRGARGRGFRRSAPVSPGRRRGR